MERKIGWLGMGGKRRTQPARVATDTILPVHFWDDISSSRSIVLHLQFRFDDVLDTTLLVAALEKLLRREGWSKLGGRIRRNNNGKLEVHVPEHFDEQRPAFRRYYETYGSSINEHPIASKLPAVSSSPQVVGNAADFLPLMRRPDDPKCLEDYLFSDDSTIGLHMISFEDATLITLTWGHILFDAMGCKELLDAWSRVLHGRENEVLPFHGASIDPLISLGTDPPAPYIHASRKMKIWQLVLFGLRYVADQLFWRPIDENRIICIPKVAVQELRNVALADIKRTDRDNRESEGQFLSEGDVMSALATRLIISIAPKRMKQTISLNIIFGLRWLLAADLLPAGTAYTGNAATTLPMFWSTSDFLSLPLGAIAAHVRRAISELGTREQVEARVSIERDSIVKTDNPALIGDPWMHLIYSTNWTKAQYHHANFSAAVTRAGQHIGSQQPGRPSYVHTCIQSKGFSLISSFSIVGKDADGNYWIQMILRRSYWAKMDKALQQVLAKK